MASNPTIAHPPIKKGCSSVVVFMIAIFCLVVGFIAGVGVLYGYLSYNSNALATLGLESSTPTPAPAVAQPTAQPDSAAAPEVYALVYPIEETLRIEGKIDPTTVRNRVTTQRFKFQECYKDEIQRSPNLKGEIALQFTVSNSSGTIIAAVSRQNTTGSDALARCLINDIKSWKFASIPGGELSVVKFDTLFLPISSVRPPE